MAPLRTPSHHPSSETRPLYLEEIAKLRRELMSILKIKKENVKIRTYSPRKDPEIRGTNEDGRLL